MQSARRCLAPLAVAALLVATPSLADGPVCAPVSKVPLERYLRQLTLDLLGRPPTYEEYRAAQARGEVTVEDVRALMEQEAFYERLRDYHRALLWSNVSGSISNNRRSRLFGTGESGSPLSLRGTASNSLRGANDQVCNAYIDQDACNAWREDPHAEPAGEKACYDERGVPLPVSWDYDTSYFRCERLDQNPTNATITSCEEAEGQGRIDPKYRYFCDMRRRSDGSLVPYLCMPDPGRSTTVGLTKEELDGSGRVVAFTRADPNSTTSPMRLDRCTLELELEGGVRGSYDTPRGCIQREGYVKRPAAPFWFAEGGEVAVCAIEAQTRAANPWTLESCESARFSGDRSCGCGERMRRCEASDGSTHSARLRAINDEPLWLADSVVRRDEPYFNILTTRRSSVNGPLSALHRDAQGVGVFNITHPAELAVIPAVPFAEEETWRDYVRGEEHSGVLTTPSYLFRFPTQRARVNHFYEAFLCKTFAPPEDASLPPAEDACNRENNLAKRCGCNYCHATIEPVGAHWGRFAERAALFLDPEIFPRLDPKCRDCALAGNTSCGGECGQYIMKAYDGDGAGSLGMLTTYLYRTPDEELNIEGGPSLLVQRMLQTGDLERCTVRRVWQEFLGRPMSAEEQRLYLEPLAEGFARDGHRFKALIESVVMTDAYRRID